jgi:hypothetical protein
MGSHTDYERGFLAGLVVGEGHYGPYHHNGRYFLRLMLRGALKSCLDIFDSLRLDRWCPHVARRYEAMRAVAMVARTLPSRTVS